MFNYIFLRKEFDKLNNISITPQNILYRIVDEYAKVLLVNPTSREFVVIKAPSDEESIIKSESINNIDSYWDWFMLKSNLIHKQDVSSFLYYVKSSFPKGKLIYRRRDREGWKYVHMEALQLDTKYILLVRDIHQEYLVESASLKNLINNFDESTGLRSKIALEKDYVDYSGTMGIIFADVNGLKYTNDHFGHEMGDKLLKDFAARLRTFFGCDPESINKRDQTSSTVYKAYHISGDEFIIIATGAINSKEFIDKSQEFHSLIWELDVPSAAVGFSLSEVNGNRIGSTTIPELIRMAELDMYRDKQLFYKMYPKYRR